MSSIYIDKTWGCTKKYNNSRWIKSLAFADRKQMNDSDEWIKSL